MAFSRASRDNLLSLKSELLSDPQGLGYGLAIASDNYRGVASALNNVGPETIDPAIISTGDLQGAVDPTEFLALTDRKATLWLSILQAATASGIRATNPNIRAQIGSVWAAGTTTRDNLGALQTRPASRMEVLFGEGTIVKPVELGRALNQT